MSDFQYESFDVDDHTYHLTFADVDGLGCKTVVAVTDEENDVHYVSEAVDQDDLDMPTSTVPGGIGLPEMEYGVPVSTMDDISQFVHERSPRELEISLARLGNEVLGADSRRERPETPSSRKARRKMAMLDHEKSPSDYMSAE